MENCLGFRATLLIDSAQSSALAGAKTLCHNYNITLNCLI